MTLLLSLGKAKKLILTNKLILKAHSHSKVSYLKEILLESKLFLMPRLLIPPLFFLLILALFFDDYTDALAIFRVCTYVNKRIKIFS